MKRSRASGRLKSGGDMTPAGGWEGERRCGRAPMTPWPRPPSGRSAGAVGSGSGTVLEHRAVPGFGSGNTPGMAGSSCYPALEGPPPKHVPKGRIRALPGMVAPPLPWAGCCNARQPFL